MPLFKEVINIAASITMAINGGGGRPNSTPRESAPSRYSANHQEPGTIKKRTSQKPQREQAGIGPVRNQSGSFPDAQLPQPTATPTPDVTPNATLEPTVAPQYVVTPEVEATPIAIDLTPVFTEVTFLGPDYSPVGLVHLDSFGAEESDYIIVPGFDRIGGPGVFGYHIDDEEDKGFGDNPSAVPFENSQRDLSAVNPLMMATYPEDQSKWGLEGIICPEGGFCTLTGSQMNIDFPSIKIFLPEKGVDHSYIVVIRGDIATTELDEDHNQAGTVYNFMPDAVKFTRYQVPVAAGRMFSAEQVAQTILSAHGGDVGTGGGDEGGVSYVTLVLVDLSNGTYSMVTHNIEDGWVDGSYVTNIENFQDVSVADLPTVEEMATAHP